MLSIFLKRFLISQIIYTCRAGFSRGAKWKQGDGSKDSNTVLELVVCVGSALDEKQVKDIKWPKHCLLINIKRGETEIVPDEGIKIIAGDYLNFITSERRAPKTKETLLKMSGY